MAKWANDLFMDAALDWVALSSLMTVCVGQPTTYAEATTDAGGANKKLADVAMTPGNTDFPKSDGVTNGRKVIVQGKTAVPVDVNGTADHIALVTVSGTVLRYITTCTPQALTQGNTVNIPNWNIEVADPT